MCANASRGCQSLMLIVVYKVYLMLLGMSRNAEAFLRKLINDTLVDDSNSVFKIDSRYSSVYKAAAHFQHLYNIILTLDLSLSSKA
ncbi:hypothetical protein T10_10615 [Trichinella papuae]|uniref:Uncharacterized protein n=1 Tax=Trichinella papuae TaxID=268474 RepID=A0A0V1M223_9BILA|nr:hypothetical protein T10_10615 [Trichinella papuae]